MTRSIAINRRTARNAAGLLVVVAVLAPFVVSSVPQVVGANHSYTVLSSSMSPTIKAGDQVIVRNVAPQNIHKRDVITFHPPSGEYAGANRVTHRVVGVVKKNGKRYFRTKGDANDAPDPALVPASNVVGVVWFHIPKIGYILQFGSTPVGWIAFIIVPFTLLVVSEVYDLLLAPDNADDDTKEGDAHSR